MGQEQGDSTMDHPETQAAMDTTPSAGDVAARLALGQLVKELTVGMGMPWEQPKPQDSGSGGT
jgi:hypothetical protein